MQPHMDLILLAALAGYLIYKLYDVLGYDEEMGDNSLPKAASSRMQTAEGQEINAERPKLSSSDPEALDVESFLKGAQIAFETILHAYAAGDLETLESLLSPTLFELYRDAIEKRNERGEVLETTVVRIKSAEILESKSEGRKARITVKFISEQIFLLRNKDGEILEGDSDLMEEVKDVWTFSRDISSKDPNWLLISSQAQE